MTLSIIYVVRRQIHFCGIGFLFRGFKTAWRFILENVRNFNVRNVAGSALSLFSYAITSCAFADPASKSSVIYSTRLRQFAEAATVSDVGRRAKSYVSQ